ncbi:MAG: NAD/NADP octopine/nopaline dehydrogenase family protein [Oscillospiraceae bacterium]|nr:NAD/NADP octopine/nopaline dehydrogenase family protein [Oscillospiraceae bacterium]
MKVAIISSGHGGQAMAGYFSMRGADVSLFTRVPEIIDELSEKKSIELDGVYTGRYPLAGVCADMAAVIDGASLIMVTTPSHYQHNVAELMAPHLRDGQIIVLNPGRTFGTYEFENTLLRAGCTADYTLAETDTFVFTCRNSAIGVSHIFKHKDDVELAAHEPGDTPRVLEALAPFFPNMRAAKSVLHTGLQNIGMVLHPIPILMNITRVERAEDFLFYKEAITPVVCMMIERVDAERMAVAEALGVEVFTALDWMRRNYGVQGDKLYEAIQNNPAYDDVFTPKRLDTRYIFEDISSGHVPVSCIGDVVGVPTPNINSVIQFASNVFDYDFMRRGRNSTKIDIIGLIDAATKHPAKRAAPPKKEEA